jgi:2-succinyl-5-enolpyruvyl-6-hydroxy-3-cyclohexene-1-carboxylate synthase
VTDDDGGSGGTPGTSPEPSTVEAPNENTLWGRVVVQELVRSGVRDVCLTPGSRCTPLTVAFAEHPAVTTHTHIDERSAAFYALGRAKATGQPTPLVCTSGTALANYHPAVMEADRARVPMLLLTADRPRVLQDSGANQTVDQEKLYGDAVRAYRTLPEPAAEDRTIRALRTAVSRAVATSTRSAGPPGPVHLNVPFEKPLEPIPDDSVPADWADGDLAARGRADDRPYVETTAGRPDLPAAARAAVIEAVNDADRGLVVAGPADEPTPDRDALLGLARATGFPVLADPLSGLRFGDHVDADGVLVCGAYDDYLDAPRFAPGSGDAGEEPPVPDLVLRFGASPTSKTLRHYLRDATREAGTRQLVVDPAGGWREAEFTAGDAVHADPTRLAASVSGRVDSRGESAWRERFAAAEATQRAVLADADATFEGRVLREVARRTPAPGTLFVSNSMPVRDLDRFGEPRAAPLRVLGNRGASGIDGITSTAVGAGSATDGPLVLVTGDLACYHDANGLLALPRNGLEATIVVINNDGGGIFRVLPIESFDPPFTEFFRTPLGLDLSHLARLYGLDFARVHPETDGSEAFGSLFDAAVESDGSHLIEVVVDGEGSHRTRERLHERVRTELE